MDFYRRYSLVLLLKPSLSLDGVKNMESVINNLISNFGTIHSFNYCDVKPLCYIIKKHKTAHFVQLYLQLNEDRHLGVNIKELKRKMSLNDDILRYLFMITSNEENYTDSLRSFSISH